tara:strand:- start:1811 stop:3541 length:1731 start_codon:yes stop_codon:yes gene_type:complete
MFKYIKIFFGTLDNYHKKQLYVISLMIFLSVFFDTLGIGMIIPIINLLVDNNLIDKYPFLTSVFNLIGSSEKNIILLYFIIFLGVIFFIKNFFLGLLTWKKSFFTYSIQNFYSKKLINHYLNKPYIFHVDNNSSKLINNIINETSLASGQFILSLIDLFIDIMVIVALFILLLFVEPLITISMIIIFIFFGSIYFLAVKQKLLEYGYIRQKTYAEQLKLYKEVFSNIKFFLIHKKIKKIINKISFNLKSIRDFNVRYIFISAFPKLLFEYVIIIIFCLIILGFVYNESLLIEDLVPSLALFAAAAFRILPSSNKILLSLQKLKYSKSAIELISKEIGENKIIESDGNDKNLEFKKLIFKNVCFRYKNKVDYIFKDVSFEIKKGKIYGIIGTTGSGKTTLTDIIMGLHNVNKGEIIINDNIHLAEEKLNWQKLIGYVPQKIFLQDDTIKNNIAFGELDNEIDELNIKKSIKLAQLENFINSLDDGYNTKVGEDGSKLSGGQIQRIGIARALYSNPEILILDEITSHLDSTTESKLLEDIKVLKKDKTVIFITHKSSTLKICDEVYQVQNRKILKYRE